MDEADTAINSLAHMPERYAPVDDQVLAALGIRFIQVKNYLAFYVIAKDTCTVHIVRFLYCQRQLENAVLTAGKAHLMLISIALRGVNGPVTGTERVRGALFGGPGRRLIVPYPKTGISTPLFKVIYSNLILSFLQMDAPSR